MAKPGALNASPEHHELMPEVEVLKEEIVGGAEKGPKKGEGGPEEHSSLPDKGLCGSPAENGEVCVPTTIISTGLKDDVFLDLDRLQF